MYLMEQPAIINDNKVVLNNYLFSRCPNFSQNTYNVVDNNRGG